MNWHLIKCLLLLIGLTGSMLLFAQGNITTREDKAIRGTTKVNTDLSKSINLLTDSILSAGNNTMINDSTKLLIMDEYTVRKFAKRRDQNRYNYLLDIVKKVYPLAKLAGNRMEEYAAAVDTLKRGQVDDFVAEIEDEVKTKYGADLRKLNFKEGIVLLKLLDRQTAKTPYRIIKELKSGFSAMIWQALASLFDYNLKDEFNPNGVEEDKWIDEICVLIDKGKI